MVKALFNDDLESTSPHFDLCLHIADIVGAGEDKRVLCQLLNKLSLPTVEDVDDLKIRTVKLLMNNIRTVGVFPCVPSGVVSDLCPSHVAPPSARLRGQESVHEVRERDLEEV